MKNKNIEKIIKIQGVREVVWVFEMKNPTRTTTTWVIPRSFAFVRRQN